MSASSQPELPPQRIVDALRLAAEARSTSGDNDVFCQLARHLAQALGVAHAFIGELYAGREPEVVHVIGGYFAGRCEANFDYPLRDTPCRNVVGQCYRFYPDNIQARFLDPHLRELGAEGYAAIPLFSSTGGPIGIMAALDTKPLTQPELTESLLKIFAVRAALELEQRHMLAAKQRSEANYRTLFEATDDAVFIYDLTTGVILDVNPRACETYGYSREEFHHLSIGALSAGYRPYTAAEARQHFERARAGQPTRFEWRTRHKDGSLRWDEVKLKRFSLGDTAHIIAFTRDITARKEHEEALHKSEDRLRATVEAALDCIVGMDGNGDIIDFNPAAERCFGIRKQDAVGRSLADLVIPPRYRQAHQQGLERFHLTHSGPYIGKRVEVTAMRADGSEFPVELAIDHARGKDGTIFIGYLRDITERKQAERERAQLEAQLRQAQKMEAIGHLTGGIAHDFNNILTTALGYTVMAQERLAQVPDAKLEKYLDRVQQAGQKARHLIQQMLTFSRGQHGTPQPLQLATILAESVDLITATFPSTIELTTRCEAACAPLMIDPVHFEQILLNLCINARDAMPQGGTLDVSVSHHRLSGGHCRSCHQPVEGNWVELCVSDQGTGIADSVLERMFEPFFSTKQTGKSSGMGLSTVHGLVHDYAGHILVDTTAGQGTTFRVLFKPLPVAATDRSAGLTPTAVPPAQPQRLSGRVLLVDDEAMVAEFMGDLLSGWGLEPTVVLSSTEALTLLDSDAVFDLVITDQTMPRMTGLQLAHTLCQRWPALPVILYTGFSDDLTDAQALAAGVRAFLRKPVDTGALHQQLSELLTTAPPGTATKD
ncbi:PAS domain-containing hybrid sensor histidine kinase/response regulator [Litchfieldella rifensis]|uniref:histidine kinase n=1 Tax=Litchfieldella rifensis TaxID=762643 RepID=A0ABV7LUL9_9GAMM